MTSEEAEELKVQFIEEIDSDGDVELSFATTVAMDQRMQEYLQLHRDGKVDVVFCPLPMITAIKGVINDCGEYPFLLSSSDEFSSMKSLKDSPFRAIRIEDRIKKLVSIHKQCL